MSHGRSREEPHARPSNSAVRLRVVQAPHGYVSGFNTGAQVAGLVPYATCLEVTPSGALTIAKRGLKVAHAKKRGE
jgi:hypothetical protein